MRKVYFHGRMGRLFGKVWDLEVDSPAEAIRAIEAITGKLYDYFQRCTDREVGFKIVIGKMGVQMPSELLHKFSETDAFHFYPIPCGNANDQRNAQKKASIWQIVIGAVLIIIGAIINVWSGGSLSLIGNAFISSGIAMIIGGVVGLLMKPPAGNEKDKSYDGSYLFQGQVNTTRQGGPIPIGYGEMIVGSQVISVSIRNEKIAVPIPSYGPDAEYPLQWQQN